jgi:hypothetical protein
VFKNDTAVKLYISLTDGGKPYFIGEHSSAIFYGKRADDVPLVHLCEISESNTEVIYEFENTTACVEGIVNAQIRLYGADQKLITAPEFTIVVDEKVAGDDEIEETLGSPLSALDAIFVSEREREDYEAERRSAEANRIINENTRLEQEDARQSAENFRDIEEQKRQANAALLAQIPVPREGDEGKLLRVVDGIYQLENTPSALGVEF